MEIIEVGRIDVEMVVEVLRDVLRECHETMPEYVMDDVVYALAYFRSLLV